MQESIATVVVTYNRLSLLKKCLLAIAAQSRAVDAIFIVDNASSDGTVEWLKEWLPTHLPNATAVFLPDNQGGAGGFATGLNYAVKVCDWVWMMDDDAEPHPGALEELMKVADNPNNVYGSLAVSGQDTAWTTIVLDDEIRKLNRSNEVPEMAKVQSLPFLGFMIHQHLVEKIGLPDAGYFIAADDVEYCLRAERQGANIIIAGKSHIEHPKSDRYFAHLPGRSLVCLRLAPWKRYYDTRNRLLIAKKYFGIKILTQTIPGSFVRLLATLIYEPNKWSQTRAFMAGFIDGLLGRKGRRHDKWGINT